jgi:hypothetical protein
MRRKMENQSEFTEEQLWEALDKCLENFDVPSNRKKDLGWLQRNLHIRNADNAAYSFTMGLIIKLLKIKVIECKNLFK